MSESPAPLPIVIVTRFSYIGNSGWKIPVADREQVVFDTARLEFRLWLFEHVTVASLLAQTDQNFRHYILTSDQLPDWALQRLTAICAAAYPADRFKIDRQPVGNARKYLRLYMAAKFKDTRVVQIVLDDDDGLSHDFIAKVTKSIAAAQTDGSLSDDAAPFFLSFRRGYGLVFGDQGKRQADVYLHSYPYINLGLTLVDRPSRPNILAIDHVHAPKRAGCKSVGSTPMYVRSIHNFNDSRAEPSKFWQRIEGDMASPTLTARFPYLAKLA